MSLSQIMNRAELYQLGLIGVLLFGLTVAIVGAGMIHAWYWWEARKRRLSAPAREKEWAARVADSERACAARKARAADDEERDWALHLGAWDGG